MVRPGRRAGRTSLDTEDIDAIANALGMSGFELLVKGRADMTILEQSDNLDERLPIQ